MEKKKAEQSEGYFVRLGALKFVFYPHDNLLEHLGLWFLPTQVIIWNPDGWGNPVSAKLLLLHLRLHL